MRPRDAFIVAWVAAQMALPMSYYLRSERVERYDERFSWRMFSDIRMVKCKAEFAANGEPVQLSREFHVAWDSLVQRGRPQVMAAVTERLCSTRPGKRITLKMRCREPDASEVDLSTGDDDLCEGR